MEFSEETKYLLRDLAAYLSCSNCSNPSPTDPILLPKCSHSLCQKCAGDFTGGNCPVFGCGVPNAKKVIQKDRALIQRLEALRIMKRVILDEEEEAESKDVGRQTPSQVIEESSSLGSKEAAGTSSARAKKRDSSDASSEDSSLFEQDNKKKKLKVASGAKGARMRKLSGTTKAIRTKKSISPGMSNGFSSSDEDEKEKSSKPAASRKTPKSTTPRGRPPKKTKTTPRTKESVVKLVKLPVPKNVAEKVKEVAASRSASASPSNVPSPATSTSSSVQRKSTPKLSADAINKKNRTGETKLHKACIKGNTKEVRHFLTMGANPNTQDHMRWTPLHEASQRGFVEIVELLLFNGAVPNVPAGDDNITPLHDAASEGFTDVARLLIKYGAKKDALSASGKTPL